MPTDPICVIIPTYNRASFLRRALDSVLAQTMKPDTLIVVNDGSTDHTDAVLNEFKNIHIIRHSRNRGVSAARNSGIRGNPHARSWIAFLDSDDCWHKNKIETQLQWLEKHPQFLVCQTHDEWIRDGKRVNPGAKFRKKEGDLFNLCLERCSITPSSVMLHSKVFEDIGCFNERFRACEDYDLWLRLSLKYPVGLIPEKHTTRYQGHPGQLSLTVPVLDRFRIRALINLLQQPLPQEKQIPIKAKGAELCNRLAEGAKKRGYLGRARVYSDLRRRVFLS